METNYLN